MSSDKLRPDQIFVVGLGAQTPVGRSVPAAGAAVRCRISAYAEHTSLVDNHGEPVVVARAEWLDETRPLPDRIVTLALEAGREALNPLASNAAALREVRLHLALSASNLPFPAHRQKIFEILIGVLGVFDGHRQSALVAEDHAGGFVALENALRQLRSGEAQLCLVGGADSWLHADRLRALDRQGRLHSIHNSWGFTPGEAAGFCLLTTGVGVSRFGLSPLAELLAVSTAQEAKLMGTPDINTGEALTAAFRGVLLDPAQKVSHCYCDLNGETYRADEYGFAICRTGEHFLNAGSFTAPAESWGDVGCASAPLGMALAGLSFKQGYAKGPVALVWGSGASQPRRGAALLRGLNAFAGSA